MIGIMVILMVVLAFLMIPEVIVVPVLAVCTVGAVLAGVIVNIINKRSSNESDKEH